MKLSQLIRKKEGATATVATFATVTPPALPSVASVASVAVATATDGKPETLLDRQREARRQKVIAMLEAHPEIRRAILTEINGENVIVTIALRHVATFEMLIPKARYDPWALLELIERQGQTTH